MLCGVAAGAVRGAASRPGAVVGVPPEALTCESGAPSVPSCAAHLHSDLCSTAAARPCCGSGQKEMGAFLLPRRKITTRTDKVKVSCVVPFGRDPLCTFLHRTHHLLHSIYSAQL